MKETIWLLLVLLTVVGVWLVVRPQRKVQQGEPATSNQQQSPDSNLMASSTRPAKPTTEEMELKRPPGVDAAGWSHLLMLRRLILEANQPVEFHARIVDQQEQPVAGALLKLNLTRVDETLVRTKFPNMNMGDEQVEELIELSSDADGWIRLTGRTGKSVYVVSLVKDGYLWTQPTMGSFLYESAGRHRVGYKGMEAAFDPSKGYTFHLWKKGRSERLIPVSVRVNMDNEQQGQWVSNYFVGFLSAKVLSSRFRGVDLLIQGVRHPTGLAERPYEFTFTFTVPNGGILASEDFYPYRAPETGYETAWTFVNKPMSRGPEDGPWTRTFYFKLRDGKAFAGMRVSFQKTNFDLVFDGHLNPAGSRNLEPDPNLLIVDPEEIRRLDDATQVR